MQELKILKLRPEGRLPEKANQTDLGYDLFSAGQVVIAKGKTGAVNTAIAIQLPDGWGGIIKDRSSMAIRGITVSGGVIDNGYRGEIIVLLTNNSTEDITIERDDKIAQLVPAPVTDWRVTATNKLNHTKRGAGGFGSTNATRDDR